MYNNDILNLWSKIIEKLGTRNIVLPLNMTYISPTFLELFRGVLKKATTITVFKFSKILKVKIALE